jgi:hypothetical protein
MNPPRHRPGLLPPDGIGSLLVGRSDIWEKAAGSAPEALVQATLQAVACLSRGDGLRQALAPRVFALVRHMLACMQ